MSLKCAPCKKTALDGVKIYFCSACNYHWCAKCWSSNIAHQDSSLRGPNGLPHEKTDPGLVESLKECMQAPEDEAQAHLDDRDTAWFGVWTDPDNGEYLFQDQGTYASIMAKQSLGHKQQQYPKLVSIMGETGAGKSSLIKLLLGIQDEGLSFRGRLSRPVVGTATDQRPTSSDVHLFSDPNTFSSEQPILYADSEGMGGGTMPPIADLKLNEAEAAGTTPRWAWAIRRRIIKWASNDRSPDPTKNEEKHITKRAAESEAREEGTQPTANGDTYSRLKVYDDGSTEKPKNSESPDENLKRRRHYAVREMYPRILYAFSDVIIYVLVNVKTFESIAESLLGWAQADADGSINLPTRPHAIIVLNKCSADVDDLFWDPSKSTSDLLDFNIVDSAIFQKYCRMGVVSMKQLLSIYYSDVTVVRMPEKSNFELLDQQRQMLYRIIKRDCERSHLAKSQTQMLADSDDLQLYLQSAFDLFSESLDTPFDFIAASIENSPIPRNLSEHLLRLAVAVTRELNKKETTKVFARITQFVASCILLDAARKNLLGGPRRWFDHTKSDRDSIGNAASTDRGTTAYEFLSLQWATFGNFKCRVQHVLDLNAESMPAADTTAQAEEGDKRLEQSSFDAHLKLLRVARHLSPAVQATQSSMHTFKAKQQLLQWHAELPISLKWESRGENWPRSTFFLHQQYRALLTMVDPSYVVDLLNAIQERRRILGSESLPLPTIHHAKVAADAILLDRQGTRQPSIASIKVQNLMDTISELSKQYSGHSQVLQDYYEKLEQHQSRSIHPKFGLSSPFSITEFSNLDVHDLIDLGGPDDLLGHSGSESRTTTNAASDTLDLVAEWQQPSTTGESYRSSFMPVSDPVFGAYADELNYVNGYSDGDSPQISDHQAEPSPTEFTPSQIPNSSELEDQLHAYLFGGFAGPEDFGLASDGLGGVPLFMEAVAAHS